MDFRYLTAPGLIMGSTSDCHRSRVTRPVPQPQCPDPAGCSSLLQSRSYQNVLKSLGLCRSCVPALMLPPPRHTDLTFHRRTRRQQMMFMGGAGFFSPSASQFRVTGILRRGGIRAVKVANAGQIFRRDVI